MSNAGSIGSVSGLSALKQILYIRDYLDYNTFLKEGDKAKNIPTPLTTETVQSLQDPDKGWTLTLRGLVEQFNKKPEDVKKAAELFGIEVDKNNPQVKAYQFSEAKEGLTIKEDRSDLKAALCKIDPKECPLENLPPSIPGVKDHKVVSQPENEENEPTPIPFDQLDGSIKKSIDDRISEIKKIEYERFLPYRKDKVTIKVTFTIAENGKIKIEKRSIISPKLIDSGIEKFVKEILDVIAGTNLEKTFPEPIVTTYTVSFTPNQ